MNWPTVDNYITDRFNLKVVAMIGPTDEQHDTKTAASTRGRELSRNDVAMMSAGMTNDQGAERNPIT